MPDSALANAVKHGIVDMPWEDAQLLGIILIGNRAGVGELVSWH